MGIPIPVRPHLLTGQRHSWSYHHRLVGWLDLCMPNIFPCPIKGKPQRWHTTILNLISTIPGESALILKQGPAVSSEWSIILQHDCSYTGLSILMHNMGRSFFYNKTWLWLWGLRTSWKIFCPVGNLTTEFMLLFLQWKLPSSNIKPDIGDNVKCNFRVALHVTWDWKYCCL